MVLVGISLIIASLTFVIYRHPPSSWPYLPGVFWRLWHRGRPHTPNIVNVSDATDGSDAESKFSAARIVEVGELVREKRHTGLLSMTIKATLTSPGIELDPPPATQTTPKALLFVPPPPPNLVFPSLDESDSSEDDSPPTFPSKYSAQRASGPPVPAFSGQAQLSRPNGSFSMPPPPRPMLTSAASRARANPSASSFSASAGPGSSLRPVENSLALPPTITQKPAKPRKKVILTPGHSPLDWARLQASGTDLRGLPHPHLIRVPPSELRLHNKRADAWSVFGGKVFNITPYLLFHPGGERELMKAAGRDGTKLFMEIHPWVNWDTMLGECLIGMAIEESAADQVGNTRKDMDVVGKEWEDID